MSSETTKQQFSTGAQRDSQDGKLRFDLLSTHALRRTTQILTDGATRYGDRNWEAGFPFSRCLASAWRHFISYIEGDTKEDHLSQLACNIMFLQHFEEKIKAGNLDPKLDDRENPCIFGRQYKAAPPAPVEHVWNNDDDCIADAPENPPAPAKYLWKNADGVFCEVPVSQTLVPGTVLYSNLRTGPKDRRETRTGWDIGERPSGETYKRLSRCPYGRRKGER
jgi:hypothetical protein